MTVHYRQCAWCGGGGGAGDMVILYTAIHMCPGTRMQLVAPMGSE